MFWIPRQKLVATPLTHSAVVYSTITTLHTRCLLTTVNRLNVNSHPFQTQHDNNTDIGPRHCTNAYKYTNFITQKLWTKYREFDII